MYKKNTILIFLLLLAGMPLLFPVYTLLEKKIIEHSMRERLELESLQVISIDAASVVWLKKDKEVLINGEPFDIKTITRKGDKFIISGLFDAREKVLKQQLQAYHHDEDASTSKSNALLLLIFTTCLPEQVPIQCSILFSLYTSQTWQKYQDKICSLSLTIIVPPPRS